MRSTILLLLLLASRGMAEPLSPPPAEVDARSGGSAPHEADYIYWRPDFPRRTDTPEKRQALAALLSEYAKLAEQVKQLSDDIAARRGSDTNQMEKSAECDAKLRRLKLLQAEAQLWRH